MKMEMDTYIRGIKEPNEKFKEMAKIYHSCKKINITLPDEVYDFFGGDPPNKLGDEVDIDNNIQEIESGLLWLVTLKDLPKNLTHIQFENKW